MFDGKLGEDKWLSNLLIARARWVSVPVEKVWPGLDGWHCDTYACFMGHCCTWPEFMVQGVCLCGGVPGIKNEPYSSAWDAADLLFGCRGELVNASAEVHCPSARAHAEVLRRLDTAIAERRAVLGKVMA